MELELVRYWPVPAATIGVLSADGRTLCFTLEDQVREIAGLDVAEWKVPGQTAIPRGRYRVLPTFSERFGHLTPQLIDVPGFSSIRIHKGNTSADTEGCVLVGERRDSDVLISDCEPAYEMVTNLIDDAIANAERVWITIR